MNIEVDEKFDFLHRLIKRADIAGIRRELETVDASLSNAHGWTLLMLAAHEGNVPLGELLISKGADLDARTSNGGVTALSQALMAGHIPFMKLLLDHGAKRQRFENIAAWLPKLVGEQRTEAMISFLKDCRESEGPS